ncbi:MAG: SEL1-like repeat protein [Acidimicrobiales bacterium]
MDHARTMQVAVAAADRLVGALESGAWLDDGSPAGAFLGRLVALVADLGPGRWFLDDLTTSRERVVRGWAEPPSPEGVPRVPSGPVEERAGWAGTIVGLVAADADVDALHAEVTAGGVPGPAMSEAMAAEVTRLALWWQGGRSRDRDDLREAEAWFRLAVDAGHLPARNDLASALDDLGHARAARVLWTAAATDGDAAAAGNLGALYDRQGDMATSEAWFRRATELGHLDASVRLGQRLYHRDDKAEAEDLWRRAAAQGHGDACEYLGILLLERGDVEDAHGWLHAAASEGHAGACRQLAALYETTGRRDKAVEWLEAAVTVGHPDAADLLEALRAEPAPSGPETTRLSGRAPEQDRIDELQDRVDAHDRIARQTMRLGRWDDAHQHNVEALAAVRELRRIDPDNPDNETVLAAKLYNQATIAGSRGRIGDAIDAANEAVALYRDAATADPGYRPQLADAQARLGRLISVMGASPLVEALFDDAATIYRHAAGTDPDRARDLGRILSMRADARHMNPSLAAETAGEAVRIYRRLTGPLTADDQQHFGLAALRVAKDQLARGYGRDALGAAREAVEQFTACTRRSPGDAAGWSAHSLAVLACCHEAVGDLDAAREAMDAADQELARHPASQSGRADAEELLSRLRQRLG